MLLIHHQVFSTLVFSLFPQKSCDWACILSVYILYVCLCAYALFYDVQVTGYMITLMFLTLIATPTSGPSPPVPD